MCDTTEIPTRTKRVWCRIQRFVMWLREIWFTIDSRDCKGELTIWEYHVYRQYKKKVEKKVQGKLMWHYKPYE